MLPLVGGLVTLPDKTLASAEPTGGLGSPHSTGPGVCVPRTGKSCYGL